VAVSAGTKDLAHTNQKKKETRKNRAAYTPQDFVICDYFCFAGGNVNERGADLGVVVAGGITSCQAYDD